MSAVENLDERRTARRDGRVPPHNLEAEQSLLGAMFLTGNAIDAATDIGLTGSHFYKPAHGHIFDTILRLHAAGNAVDVVTVADELRRAGLTEAVGGDITLLELQAATPATSNADRYARIVEEHATLRRLISVAGEIAETSYGLPDDIDATLDAAEHAVFKLTDSRRRQVNTYRVGDILGEHLDLIEARYEGRIPPGAPTGLVDLDRLLGGLGAGQLVVPCARPSMGKTAFGLALVLGAASAGIPALFYSIEMSRQEVLDRLTASVSRVPLENVLKGDLAEKDWARLSTAWAKLSDLPIDIVDDPNATLQDIRSACRRQARTGLGLVVIDYLQQIRSAGRFENRQVEIADITRGIKRIARDLEVPVVALAQLNRNLEQRADKRPLLSDLRESGEIEQAADVVIGLYRDDYYREDSPDKGILEAIVLKQRNGPTGVARLHYQLVNQRIDDLVPRIGPGGRTA